MPSNSFTLGKYNRREYSSQDINPNEALWEGDGVIVSPITHYHNDPKQYSKHTGRDEMQAVGKLYKGHIDDE